MEYINKIICGDCLSVMKDFPDNSIDTIITDPPYGIGFMGKEWDNFDIKSDFFKKTSKGNQEKIIKPEIRKSRLTKINSAAAIAGLYDQSLKGKLGFYNWCLPIMKELLRVTKPGGTMLIFGGTRTYHRLACAIEDAGWILKDCIMWLYGSGFPKATDIGQILDKDECRKQLEDKLGRKPTQEEFKKKWEGFRKIAGKYELPDVADGKRKKGWDCTNTTDVGVFGVSGQQNITAPATPEAILWDGWKSHGLKPAYEPILVAMKPNEGSYANNAMKWGVAGLNVDGGRIGTKDRINPQAGFIRRGRTDEEVFNGTDKNRPEGNITVQGRFPANIILDEEAARLLDEQSGVLGTSYRPNSRRGKIKSDIYMNGIVRDGYPTAIGVKDKGGASRFFYCAKASKAERNRGCENIIPKAKCEIDKMGGSKCTMKTGSGNDRNVSYKNNHPTVKPLSLMKYLCMITKTPTGGIVLDPFCGSGTTLIACKETGRDYIGIEKDSEYVEIARNRINAIPETLF